MAAQDSQSFDNQHLDDRLLRNCSLEQISIEDWAATPESVKQLVSALLVQQLDQGAVSEHKSRHQSPQQHRREIDREDPAPNNNQENISNNTQDRSRNSGGSSGGSYSLTQFLDATSVGMAVHDTAGNLVYINQAGKDLLTNTSGSVEKAEELPQAFHVYRSTTGQPYPLEELPSSLALTGKKAQADDLEVHHPDRIIPLEVVANPVFDSNGQVIHVIATFQDITQRRQAEQALMEARISYQKVVESQTDFLLRSSPDTSISFANPAICRALGRNLEEMIGYKWIDFANPEDLQDILRKIGELTPTNSSFLAENRDRRGDDSIGWTQWLNQGIFNSQGELVEIQSVGRDITALKQTMMALRESEARFRNITENIPGAVFRYLLRADGSDAVIYMSSGCYDLWEVEAQTVETDAKVLWEMIHPEDVGKMFESVLKSAQNLEPWFFEWRITSPSGKQKWLQAVGRPERTPEGNTLWDTLVLEVSDRKRTELELQAQQELLQLVFDYMPVMASIFSPTGEILMINRHLEQVIGWTQADYQNRDVLKECYPDSQDYETTKEHVSKADSTWKEVKTRVRDGRFLDIRWIQVRLADGRSIAIGQDITEQKRLITSLAEINQELELRVAQRTEALERQDALLRESQRVARLGSWEAIPETDVVYWSPEMFQILGYDPSLPAPSVSQQRRNFAPEDWQRLTALIDRAIKFGESYELDLQIIREDGSRGCVFAKGQPILDEAGQIQRLVGVAMDISDRKAAEQEIIHSRDLREAIFNESADALFLVESPTGLTLDCNRRAVELFEVADKAELIGILGHTLQLHQFNPEEVAAITSQVAAKGFWSQEIEYVSRQGRIFWGNIAVTPIMVAGEMMRLVRLTDISDRKAAEQEVIRNRDLREAIFNELADALFLVDSETLLTLDCNQKAIELFGVSQKADLIGIEGHILQRYQFTAEELEAIEQEMAVQGTWSRELEFVTRQGNFFWGNIAAKPIVVAGKTMNLVRVTDISDRKAAETALADSEAQNRAILQAIPDMMFRVNRAGMYLSYSGSKELLLSFGNDQIINQLMRDYLPSDQYHIQAHYIAVALETRQTQVYEQEVTIAGILQQEEVRVVPIEGREEVLFMIRDISSRKQAEIKIQKTSQKLEAANRELEAFAYSVSHDLRSPLRAIDGFSKALMEDYGDQFDEEAQDYFDRIHRAVERMGSLIDDLLRLSRVSRAEIQHSQINLTEIAQEIATDLQASQPDRQVEFLITPGMMVYADSNLLRVALENLLQNAWKFTSHHPTARIEIGTIAASQIDSSKQIDLKINQKQGEDLVYFVRDDGAGFDMAYASMLFGVFQRLHNTHEFPGTGIGLATVQRVIHRHGGRVWAEGVVEAGATIYFTIPHND